MKCTAATTLGLAVLGMLLLVEQASAASNVVRGEEHLTSDCFDFPSTSFGRENCVKCTYGKSPHIILTAGSTAVDFTASDLSGNLHTMSDYLDKPVVLLFGMYTCPAYQGLGTSKPFDEASYQYEWDLVESYSDKVNFIHMVGPEPHPTLPDSNFDSGVPRLNYWSTVSQPLTWDDRKAVAERVATYTHPNAVLLLDAIEGNPYTSGNNHVWCTYGPGARTAFIIGRDGKVKYTQTWFRASDLQSELDSLLE